MQRPGQNHQRRAKTPRDLNHKAPCDDEADTIVVEPGAPVARVARLVVEGAIEGPGVLPPERIGRDAALLERVLAPLAARGVTYTTAHAGG